MYKLAKLSRHTTPTTFLFPFSSFSSIFIWFIMLTWFGLSYLIDLVYHTYLNWFLTGLGICSLVFCANRSFFESERALRSFKRVNRFFHSFCKKLQERITLKNERFARKTKVQIPTPSPFCLGHKKGKSMTKRTNLKRASKSDSLPLLFLKERQERKSEKVNSFFVLCFTVF